MITYKQVGDKTPKDIEATTDDGGAELAKFDSACTEVAPTTKVSLDAARPNDDGLFVFTIDSDEAGELSDALEYGEDEYSLSKFISQANESTLAELEPKD